MIFGTIINGANGSTKSLTLLGNEFKSLTQIIHDYKTTETGFFDGGKKFKSAFSGLFDGGKFTSSELKAISEYRKLIADGRSESEAFDKALRGTREEVVSFAKSTQQTNTSIKALSASEKAATITTELLSVALNTLLTFGATLLFQKIASEISKISEAEKEAQEKAEESRLEADKVTQAYKNEMKSLNDSITEYVKLYTTTSNLNSEKERLLEIQDAINQNWSDEKEKVDLLNKSLEENLSTSREITAAEANKTILQLQPQYEIAKANQEGYSKSFVKLTNSEIGKTVAKELDQAFLDYFDATTDYIKVESQNPVTGEKKYEYRSILDRRGDVLGLNTTGTGNAYEEYVKYLDLIIEKYEHWDGRSNDVANDLIKLRNEVDANRKSYIGTIDTYEYAEKVREDYSKLSTTDIDEQLDLVLQNAIDKIAQFQEATGMSKYFIAKDIEELKTEALSLAGDNTILADSVNSVFANYNSGLGSATDSLSDFNTAWFKNLDDFEKEQVSVIDTMVKAIQKIATGERISEKDFFDIFELDTDHILKDINIINGEASMSLESLIKLKDSYIQKQIETYKSSNEKIREEYQDELTELAMYKLSLEQIQKEIAEKNIDITKTVYGNVDTDTREILEWSDKNLEKYADAIESWGMSANELQGTVSTVLGSVDEFNGIDIAFTPVLETANGSILLDHDTVYKYINSIMSKLDNEWTSEDLFKLDAEGLEVNGIKIKNILADVGDTAERTSQIMHYLGKNGALAYTEKMFNEAANSAKDITNSLDTNNTMIEYLNSLLGNTIDLTKAIEALQKKADNYQKAFETKIDGIIDGLTTEKEAIQDSKTALEKQLKILEEQEDKLKTIISNYEKVADLVNDTIETEIDGIQKAYDNQIEALKSQNEEREESLDLAKKLADLENAKNNKVVTYTEAGGFQYGVNKEAVESAQREYDNALNDAEIKRLEEERDSSIKSLEDYAKKWSAISKKSEKEEAEKLAIDILGSDWREKIANQDLDILNEYEAEYDDYGKKLNQISKVEKDNLEKSIKIKDEEIKAKEAQIKEWNNYKTHVKADIEAIKNSQEEYVKYLDDIELSEDSNLKEREKAYSEFKDRYTAIVQEIIDVTNKLNGTSATIDVRTNIEQISDEMMHFILNYGESIKKMGEALEEGHASVNSSFDAKLVEAWKALKKLTGSEGYASGGTASYTGMAMLHGTQQKSEVIFNASQGRSLYDMVHSGNFANLVADRAMDGFKIAQSRGGIINNNRNASIVFSGTTINLPNVQNPEQFAKQFERYIQTTLTESQIIPPRS